MHDSWKKWITNVSLSLLFFITLLWIDPFEHGGVIFSGMVELPNKSLKIYNTPDFLNAPDIKIRVTQEQESTAINLFSNKGGRVQLTIDYINVASQCFSPERQTVGLKVLSPLQQKLLTLNAHKPGTIATTFDDTLPLTIAVPAKTCGDLSLTVHWKHNYHYIQALLLTITLLLIVLYFSIQGTPWISVNGIFLFLIYLITDKHTFGYPGFSITCLYLLLSIGFSILFGCLIQSVGRKTGLPIYLVFSLLAYFIPLLFLSYQYLFQHPFSQEVIFAILQTNTIEAREMLGHYLDWHWLSILLIPLFIYLLTYKPQLLALQGKVKAKLLVISFLFLPLFWFSYKDIRVLSLVTDSTYHYYRELRLFKEEQERKQTKEAPVIATKQEKNEIHVVVIGESLSKEHMGLYGYHRDTTPKLSKLALAKELIISSNSFSPDIFTNQSLALSLTQSTQLNGMSYYTAPTIINTLNAAGFKTHWISNQAMMGAWDNWVSVIASAADHQYRLNKQVGKILSSSQYDESVLSELDNILGRRTSSSNNIAIFIHLMGNHSPYCSRFPEQFRRYTGLAEAIYFGDQADKAFSNRVNCYDNSVYYNDYIISEIIKLLKESTKNKTSSLIYFADHGADVLTGKGRSRAGFTFEMVSTPLLAWFSEHYKQQRPNTLKVLETNHSHPYPGDFLFDLMLGVMNVKSDLYQPHQDISNLAYQPPMPVILDKTRQYTENTNYRYNQALAGLQLSNTANIARIVPQQFPQT